MGCIYKIFRPIFFLCDPEFIHHYVINFLKICSHLFYRYDSILCVFENFIVIQKNKNHNSKNFDLSYRHGPLTFSNPFGIAPGLDKNAEAFYAFLKLNIGHIELGTVTPMPQEGNPKPRLFRLIKEKSLRNQMGFNNVGIKKFLSNLNSKMIPRGKIIGVNIGKNKITHNDTAEVDYEFLLSSLVGNKNVHYVTINISSPNTPGLRDLFEENSLVKLLSVAQRFHQHFPIYLKLSPDLDPRSLKTLVKLCADYNLFGIIATNTTVIESLGTGGVSGNLLSQKAKHFRNCLLKEMKNYPTLHLIGVGGFSTFEEIKDYWIQGGSIIQIYTALIFQGPNLFQELSESLVGDIKNSKCQSFEEYLSFIRNNNPAH